MERFGVPVQSHDSPLGRWTSAQWVPPASDRLFGLVRRIWYFDGTMTHQRERVFPDASAEIIVMLDEPHRDGDVDALPAFPAVCINGLRTRPSVVVAPPNRCRVVGIRLTPYGAMTLIASPIASLLDITIDLQDALGASAAELGERCNDAAHAVGAGPAARAAAIVRVAAEWARRRAGYDDPAGGILQAAFDGIHRSCGNVSVERLCEAVGVSQSRFTRLFRHRTGVTPKHLARITRFSNALSRLTHGESIASVANGLGYYDQPHMHRDFTEFAAMAPGAFLAANHYPGSASLAES